MENMKNNQERCGEERRWTKRTNDDEVKKSLTLR